MNNLQANICLLTVTLCWSCEVIIFSVIPDDVNPFATTCVTSLIGALLLCACFAGRIAASIRRDGWLLAKRIGILAVLNTAYSVLFLVGLDYFDVSTGAFTVSITAVVLPVMLMAMRRGVRARTWFSALCVLAGIAAAMVPSFGGNQWEGLLVMGAGSLIRALYIVKLNDWAHEHDPLTLAAGMSGMNAIIAFFPWLAMQPTTFAALPWSQSLVAAYFIYGYFVIAFAVSLNIMAQRRATPAQATIVYSTEIVFSTIWATCLPPTVVDPVELTPTLIIGCALVLAGNLVEALPDKSQAKTETAAIEEAKPRDLRPKSKAQSTRIHQPLYRKLALFAILLAVYLVIALPFKVLSVIPGFTDIRPVSLLQPIYGIFFGIPGCLAFAFGNLIGDIATESLKWSSIAGFIGSFAYPYLMYLFFVKLRAKPFELRSLKSIGLFAAAVVVCAFIQAFIISPAVALFYPDVDIAVFATTVVCNGSLFPIAFAIPFCIMLQEEIGLEPLWLSN